MVNKFWEKNSSWLPDELTKGSAAKAGHRPVPLEVIPGRQTFLTNLEISTKNIRIIIFLRPNKIIFQIILKKTKPATYWFRWRSCRTFQTRTTSTSSTGKLLRRPWKMELNKQSIDTSSPPSLIVVGLLRILLSLWPNWKCTISWMNRCKKILLKNSRPNL